MRALLPRLPLLLIPVALFAWLFHPAMLDITNIGWVLRGTDNGENALGMHAWLHAGNGFVHTGLLNAPEGISLLFTDSNPLLGLILKPLAVILPNNVQFVGPWIALSLFLHSFFAWRLLRPYAPDAVTLWAGVALMSIVPTLLQRFYHVNLMAHWLILCALWLFVDPRRARNLAAWAVLVLGTVLIHSYLLLMVAAIWGSAMLERFAAALHARERIRLVVGSAAILTATGAVALSLGAGGSYVSTGSYGFFAMPLDALWNPDTDSYSRFLPAISQREGRGFEGFQYLGLGLLILLPLGLAAGWKGAPRDCEGDVLRRLRWLIPALVVLTLLALSNSVDIAGQRLLRLPLPAFLEPVTDMVRASGRLFWPVTYTLIFAALVAAYRMHLRRARLLLLALVALQLLDLLGMSTAIRRFHADEARVRLYAHTPDPRWDALISQSREIAFESPDVTRNLQVFQDIAWRAVSAGKPVRTVYAARTATTTELRQRRETAAFRRGALVPGRLYVLIAGTIPPPGARTLRIDGVTVIPAIPLTRSVSWPR